MSASARPALVVVLALALGGCGQGGAPGDLFVVERSGIGPGARLTLRITNDGGAYCNRLARKEITSDQLLEARELRRGLNGEKEEDVGPADRNLKLGPGRRTIFKFRVVTEDGEVAFHDTSPRAPETFPKLVKLTRDVAQDACGLPR